MRCLAAGLTFVNVSTVSALLIGLATNGIGRPVSILSLSLGFFAAFMAYRHTVDNDNTAGTSAPPDSHTKAERLLRYRSIGFWVLAFFFAMFALRSFCWLLFPEGEFLRIQSPNNLGDLGLHITLIKNFANHVPLWPDHPLYVFSKLRYPAGVDLFNALLLGAGVELRQGLVWVGLLATAATFYAFYRWAGLFGASAFLFNGGMAGYQIFRAFSFVDYQGDKSIAWKSIALSMFVTQRGLLYAIPAGILLLWQWRQRFFNPENARRSILPTWAEVALYATMPLFHAHTFLALSVVLAFLFVFGSPSTRGSTLTTVALAFIPATFLTWLITDHFAAGSVLQWHPHWVQRDDDFAAPFLQFWLLNFGILPLITIALIAVVVRKGWRTRKSGGSWPQAVPFVIAGTALFLFCYFFKSAPWGWDNMKILIWAYFIILPFLWNEVVSSWPGSTRAALFVSLFLSGFVSLIGGLAVGRPGFEFVSRAELDAVSSVLRRLPANARFAAFPTYNHPLLLNGQKVVMGYPGHLWTEGLEYEAVLERLDTLMKGDAQWRSIAHELRVRYLFWGPEEQAKWATSAKPWERELTPVAKGDWGEIYEVNAPTDATRR